MQTKWYVIAGGVCSGKTSVIEELQNRGYLTVPEAAREIIDEELEKGKTIEEIRGDVLAFQKRVLARVMKNESSHSPDETVFFDRGRPDARAFLAFNSLNEPPEITKAVEESPYKKIFMLAPLTLTPEYYRTEKEDEIARIHEAHVHAYNTLSIPVVPVPVMSVTERVDYILRNLD